MFLLALLISLNCAAEPAITRQTVNANKVDREDEAILQRHRPFYFAYSSHLSKLQLSFKSPVLRGSHLYFGYSQIMFWALTEKSKPFRDLTYNPELFYRLQFESPAFVRSIDFGIWAHDSNGKRDSDSRSYDSQYVRLNAETEGKRWLTRFSVQASYLHSFDDGNAEIQKYIGPLAFSVTFIQMFDAWVDRTELALTAAPGGKFADKWDYGGYMASLSFRLGGVNLVPAFYLQYYRGYAETLLNFKEDVSEFRGGVIF